MKFASVAAVLLALSLGAEARVEIAGVDPENYVSKEVEDDVASGGVRKLQDQGVLSFKNEARNKRKGHLRSLAQYYEPDYSVSDLDDDQLVTEEQLTIEYYQDNRFNTDDPVFANPVDPSREDSGNKFLYANVPLQPIFGVDDLPIQGLAQGYCESLVDDQDGFCHFTYEFFDLQDGAIVVYASITAEGATVPQGPSTLNILGGTGEFSGAVGEITLYPVGIDESIIPNRVFKDGSLFLGNRNGYEAKFDVSIRYLLNAPLPIPVPVQMPIPAPIASPVGNNGDQAFFPNRVTCAGQPESEYCDCDADCATVGSPRCACSEAKEESCCNNR